MNDKRAEPNNALLEYQTEKVKCLIAEMVECCNERKLHESRKFDLPYAEIRFLALFSGEHYLTVKDIAQKLEVAKSRITKLSKNLLGKGLIQQIDDPMDARVRLTRLTSRGKVLLQEIETFQTEIHRQLLLEMAPDTRKNALSYLETLHGAMEAVKEKLI